MQALQIRYKTMNLTLLQTSPDIKDKRAASSVCFANAALHPCVAESVKP